MTIRTIPMPDRFVGLLGTAPTNVNSTNPTIQNYLLNYGGLEDRFQSPFIDSFTIGEDGDVTTVPSVPVVQPVQDYTQYFMPGDDGSFEGTGSDRGTVSQGPHAGTISSVAPSGDGILSQGDRNSGTVFSPTAAGFFAATPSGAARSVMADPELGLGAKVGAGLTALGTALVPGAGLLSALAAGLGSMGAYHDLNENPAESLTYTQAGTLYGDLPSWEPGGAFYQTNALSNYNSLATAPPGTMVNYGPYGLGSITAELAAQDIGTQIGDMGGWKTGGWNPDGTWNYGNVPGGLGSITANSAVGNYGGVTYGPSDPNDPNYSVFDDNSNANGWGRYGAGWVYDPTNPDIPGTFHRSRTEEERQRSLGNLRPKGGDGETGTWASDLEEGLGVAPGTVTWDGNEDSDGDGVGDEGDGAGGGWGSGIW